ncbi:MAG: Sec-independent protein translocase protein TatB [Cellvibrionaceae bacterium]
MGFFEILLIAVVTLLVVGPERMPEAVRNVALTIGRVKRSFNSARSEIEKQIGADDIRRQLHNEEVMASLDKIKQEFPDLNKPVYEEDEEEEWERDNNHPPHDEQTLNDDKSAH